MTHNQQHVDLWLKYFSHLHNTLLSMKNGVCALSDEKGNEAAIIEVPQQSDSVLLHCQLPILPEEISAAVAHVCLQLNFEMDAMRGCWLAMDEYQTLRICTQYTINSLDEQTFCALLNGFIQQAKDAGVFLRDMLIRLESSAWKSAVP